MLAAAVASSEGTWTTWGAYSKCSKSCGGGMQSRIRRCVNPSQPFGHKTCKGAFRQHRSCNVQHCPGKSEGVHAVVQSRSYCSLGVNSNERNTL